MLDAGPRLEPGLRRGVRPRSRPINNQGNKFMMSSVLRSVCVLGLLATPAAAADTYTLDPEHTVVLYALNHLGFSTSRGIFRNVSGRLVLDDKTPAASQLEVIVKTASVDGFDRGRDKALRGAQFLDVERYPEMRFVSTKVERTSEATARVIGDLTLHGVTHPLMLEATLVKEGKHPLTGAPRVGFSATGALKRSDFGVLGFLPAVGDDVVITIDAEFGAS
jgi:polyisoprenoid-binding protein YceI